MANNMSNLDANQCLRSAYDDTLNAFIVTPDSAATFETSIEVVDATNLLSAVDATAGVNSAAQNILQMKGFYIVVTAAGIDQADAVLKVQASIDGTIFVDVAGATVTIASAASFSIEVSSAMYKFFRVNYAEGTNSAGTITASYVAKG